MKAAGQLRHVGITTSEGRRHEEFEQIMRSQPLDFVQLSYSLRDHRAEQRLLPLARERGIAVIRQPPLRAGRSAAGAGPAPPAALGRRAAVHELGPAGAEIRHLAPRGDLRHPRYHAWSTMCRRTSPPREAPGRTPRCVGAWSSTSTACHDRVVDLPPRQFSDVLAAHLRRPGSSATTPNCGRCSRCCWRSAAGAGQGLARAIGGAGPLGLGAAGRGLVVGGVGLPPPAFRGHQLGRRVCRLAFGAQGLALLWAGALRGGLGFGAGAPAVRIAGGLIVILALIGVPLLGAALGRPWAQPRVSAS